MKELDQTYEFVCRKKWISVESLIKALFQFEQEMRLERNIIEILRDKLEEK